MNYSIALPTKAEMSAAAAYTALALYGISLHYSRKRAEIEANAYIEYYRDIYKGKKWSYITNPFTADCVAEQRESGMRELHAGEKVTIAYVHKVEYGTRKYPDRRLTYVQTANVLITNVTAKSLVYKYFQGAQPLAIPLDNVLAVYVPEEADA